MTEEIKQWLIFAVIILGTIVTAIIYKRIVKSRITKLNAKFGNSSNTRVRFLQNSVSAIIYIIGFGIAAFMVPELRSIGGGLLGGAGLLAVVVGIASQHALGNIVSGIFIIMFKPFRIGDRLVVQAYRGLVEDITLRHTVIRDLENKRIIIPNSIISNEIITNADFANENICRWIEVGISYASDIDLAKSILQREVMNHPLFIDVRTEEDLAMNKPIVQVKVIALAESSVNLRAWAWAKDLADAFMLSCDVLESVKKSFDNEGIEIPFPQRTLWLKDTNNVK